MENLFARLTLTKTMFTLEVISVSDVKLFFGCKSFDCGFFVYVKNTQKRIGGFLGRRNGRPFLCRFLKVLKWFISAEEIANAAYMLFSIVPL